MSGINYAKFTAPLVIRVTMVLVGEGTVPPRGKISDGTYL